MNSPYHLAEENFAMAAHERSPNLPTQLLDNREDMLETLHMAYLNALDQCAVGVESPQPYHLPKEDQKVLGRRLALYWGMKPQSDAVATALSMTAESDARMNAYTPTQRTALEAEGRAMAAKDTATTP